MNVMSVLSKIYECYVSVLFSPNVISQVIFQKLEHQKSVYQWNNVVNLNGITMTMMSYWMCIRLINTSI